MKNILKTTRYKTFYISPRKIKYCLSASDYCDYTQWNSSKIHPHAEQNRGVFREDPLGYIKINNSKWDYNPGILFTKLLEYQALLEHYNGKESWKKSKFAKRYYAYLKISKVVDRGFSNADDFLLYREKQIDALFESILKNGIYPVNIKKNKKLFVDNISIALTKHKRLYFNNRGHHRLSIAKILALREIPIKITVAKSQKNLEEFYLLNK
tara:strand:+ start:15194 stop:15826 length:633 start_codon:yes stop_codon:yes gene_type:complete